MKSKRWLLNRLYCAIVLIDPQTRSVKVAFDPVWFCPTHPGTSGRSQGVLCLAISGKKHRIGTELLLSCMRVSPVRAIFFSFSIFLC